MREIKFRAWDWRKKKMGQVSAIFWNTREWYVSRVEMDGNNTISGFILMAFTDLKDKNGKEIYEGDIFIEENDPTKYVVCWLDCGSWGFHPAGDRDMATLMVAQEDCEVIGNVYENPGLI